MQYIPDSPLGAPFTARFPVLDANGSPVASGVTLPLTLYFLGFGATATAVSGPTNATYLGGGDWGLTYAASLLATPGYYEARSSGASGGGAVTLGPQRLGFTVGAVPPEYKTLRHILTRVVVDPGLGVASTSTAAGSTTTLKDSRWVDAGMVANELVGDEIVILEPGTVGDPAPLRVSGSDPATGILTFAPPVGATVASGTDYLLLRAGKTRVRYQQVRGAIDAAVADLAERQRVVDRLTVSTTSGVEEYALPATWLEVTGIRVGRWQVGADGVQGAGFWEEPVPSLWRWHPERGTVALLFGPSSGYPLEITGRVAVPEARDFTSLVKVPWTQVRDWCVGYLSLNDNQRAGLLVQRAQRARFAR